MPRCHLSIETFQLWDFAQLAIRVTALGYQIISPNRPTTMSTIGLHPQTYWNCYIVRFPCQLRVSMFDHGQTARAASCWRPTSIVVTLCTQPSCNEVETDLQVVCMFVELDDSGLSGSPKLSQNCGQTNEVSTAQDERRRFSFQV
eukprot:991466-Amphidinium_carterae.1